MVIRWENGKSSSIIFFIKWYLNLLFFFRKYSLNTQAKLKLKCLWIILLYFDFYSYSMCVCVCPCAQLCILGMLEKYFSGVFSLLLRCGFWALNWVVRLVGQALLPDEIFYQYWICFTYTRWPYSRNSYYIETWAIADLRYFVRILTQKIIIPWQ